MKKIKVECVFCANEGCYCFDGSDRVGEDTPESYKQCPLCKGSGIIEENRIYAIMRHYCDFITDYALIDDDGNIARIDD